MAMVRYLVFRLPVSALTWLSTAHNFVQLPRFENMLLHECKIRQPFTTMIGIRTYLVGINPKFQMPIRIRKF